MTGTPAGQAAVQQLRDRDDAGVALNKIELLGPIPTLVWCMLIGDSMAHCVATNAAVRQLLLGLQHTSTSPACVSSQILSCTGCAVLLQHCKGLCIYTLTSVASVSAG